MTIRTAFSILLVASLTRADPPQSAYVFPAGGQRGTTVDVRIGGLNLHETARLHVVGEGVSAKPVVERTETLWFDGPLLRQPASQRKENYPRDYSGQFTLAADAPDYVRWYLSNSQGVTSTRPFVVGDLPEVVEHEIDGNPIPVAVKLPVTINGRIFPREDIDVWTFDLEAGQTVSCEVQAARIGSPLDSRLEVRGPDGRVVAENVDAVGNDSRLSFTAGETGTYAVRIHDVAYSGLQDHVYRLTITRGPRVEAVYPLGGRRGAKVELQPLGPNVPDEPLHVALPEESDSDRWTFSTQIAGQPAGLLALDLGDHSEFLEPNDGTPATFAIPANLNGRISEPGETDSWTFAGTKGTKLVFDLRAASLGSPLDSVLTLLDATGKTLAMNDDRASADTDSRLAFTVPADGEYVLRVSERFASRGGSRFAYRIRSIVDDAAPGFAVTLPSDAITVTRGTDTKLNVVATRLGGFNGEIALRFDGLPEGVTAEGTIPAKKPKASITLRAADDVPVQLADVTVTATATIDEVQCEIPAKAELVEGGMVTTLPLAVAIPTPFSFAADFETKYANMGCVHVRRYRLERTGYDGPIHVRLADVQARHLQGVTGPTIRIPAGATSFEYPVQLGPRMEVGRTSRSCVLAVAEVEDFDGTEHTVCFGSTAQNEQFVLLTDPPRLHVAAARKSFVAKPNGTVTLAINVERGTGIKGPVTVVGRFAPHVQDVSATSVVVPADSERAELSVRFGEAPGPFNVPFIVRASATDERGHPVVSETRIEVVPN